MQNCPSCNNTSDSSGFTSGFLLGLVIGGAGGYLLSSDKGKELLENIKENGGDKLAEVMENPAISDKLAELESAMASARKTIESTSDQARIKINQAAKEVEQATAKKPKKNLFSRRGESLK